MATPTPGVRSLGRTLELDRTYALAQLREQLGGRAELGGDGERQLERIGHRVVGRKKYKGRLAHNGRPVSSAVRPLTPGQWSTLGPHVVFFNGTNAFLVIDGSESFAVFDFQSVPIDGLSFPEATAGQQTLQRRSVARQRPPRRAGSSRRSRRPSPRRAGGR